MTTRISPLWKVPSMPLPVARTLPTDRSGCYGEKLSKMPSRALVKKPSSGGSSSSSGGSSSPNYPVDHTGKTENGTVTVSPRSAEKGQFCDHHC